MFNFINSYLEHKSPVQVTLLGLLAVALIAALDHYTGYQLSVSIFYLIPVTLVTWYGPRRAGYAICAVASLLWFMVDYTSGHIYTHWLIPIWNATVRLAFFLVTAYLLSEIKFRLQQVNKLARIDGLTQLLNAHAFKDLASHLLQQAVRHKHASALGFIDLDNFKTVNDKLGHSEGDRVLKIVSNTLSRCVRNTDVLGRLGGDEFVVFMSQISQAEAETSFNRIREELVKEAIAHNWPVGFSIGVALFPSAPSDIDIALKAADSLMYRVKHSGKNNVVYEQAPFTG